MAKGNIPTKGQKQQATLRQYESIWKAIQAKQPGEVVRVRCHESAAKRLVQAVRKEKTNHVAVRKKLSILTAGPLDHVITQDASSEGYVFIDFKLQFDGSKL